MKYITRRIINLADISRAVDPGHPDYVPQTYADLTNGWLAGSVSAAITSVQQLEADHNEACNKLACINDIWLNLHNQIQQPNIAPGAKAVLQSIADDLAGCLDLPEFGDPLPKLNGEDQP